MNTVNTKNLFWLRTRPGMIRAAWIWSPEPELGERQAGEQTLKW